MSFRRKLLAVFALTVVLSVAAVAWLVSAMTRRAFERTEDERTAALVTQFQREFIRQGEEAARRVEAIAASDAVTRMATALNRSSLSQSSSADSAEYFEVAKSLADNYQLDFLEFVDANGTIISSAQWPAKFGYPESAFASLIASSDQAAFLKQEELQDSTMLGLFAVRAVRVGEHAIYVVGGRRLDKHFLSTLDLPADTRALLYQNLEEHFSPELLLDPAAASSASKPPLNISRPAERLAPPIESVRQSNQEMTAIVHWSPDQAEDEVFHAIPLRGLGNNRPLLGILLIGNSRRSYVELKRHIRDSALLV
jgi:two-component system nitrogen regulation sensor histidine kinase NtrY